MNYTLQPCPFCGSNKIDIKNRPNRDGPDYGVQCETCGCKVGLYYGDKLLSSELYDSDVIKMKVINKWNNRINNNNEIKIYTQQSNEYCKMWFKLDKLHREDGPAIEYNNGDKKWFVDGKLHRKDGPAVECGSINIEEWYLDGKLHRIGGPAVKTVEGHKIWCMFGKNHREDGPAVERSDGSKFWFKNGKLHRENGHACENIDGSKEWHLNGYLHRTDGPAIVNNDGTIKWALFDKIYSKDEYDMIVKNIKD